MLLISSTFSFPKMEVGANESYIIETSAISNATWRLVPASAGIHVEVGSDRSIALGTVHDCGDRLMKGATVALSIKAKKISYFNANRLNPVPMNTINSTNSDGIFAFLDMPPGVPKGRKVNFVAIAKINGEMVVVNGYNFMLFPNAVSIIGMDGGQTVNFYNFEMPNINQVR